MVAASILPVTIYKNKLYFLFGKEAPGNDTPGFSDFGGGVDKGEHIYQTALREGSEELTGFLGNPKQLKSLIQKNGGVYKITHGTYHIHIFYLKYDENLTRYFNQSQAFIWNSNIDKRTLTDSKIFEKIQIEWWSENDMKSKKALFRPFYQEIVDLILDESEKIQDFIRKKVSISHSTKTRKYGGNMNNSNSRSK
jgi:hypothetical protein